MINILGMRIPISYEQAILYFDSANGFLVLALFVGVIATYAIYIFGNVKEEYVKERIAESHARSAKLEKDAADANLRAEEEKHARIKLEDSLAWRVIPKNKYPQIVRELSKTPSSVTISWLAQDIEGMQLAHQIVDLLKQAKWTVVGGGVGIYLNPMVGAFVTGKNEKAMINLQGQLGPFKLAPIFIEAMPSPALTADPIVPADMHILIARHVRPSERELLLGPSVPDQDKVGKVLLRAGPMGK